MFNSLKDAKKDDTVGISHSIVSSGGKLGYHVASIEKNVSAHVHMEGDEIYHILEGEGEMMIGKAVVERGEVIDVDWEKSYPVKKNDVFNIPEGYAHTLKNTPNSDLIIGFICPHTHLTTDRFIV